MVDETENIEEESQDAECETIEITQPNYQPMKDKLSK